jgi:predicted ATPase/DNA-binding CsgD family transcriptional regulator
MPLPNREMSNLPASLTSIIGRDHELASVVAAFDQHARRLVTLTGPGGVGKTMLALAAGQMLEADFTDGVRFVSLAPIRDPDLVLPAIGRVVGVRDAGTTPLTDRLAGYLRDKRLLLIIDNFEHVAAAAPGISDLLSSCPALAVLITSRMRLRLSGEREFPVPPLPLPKSDASHGYDRLAGYAAVRLFVERAQALQPDFTLSEDNVAAVVEICRRLDGLPLAIELAAGWTKLLPPSALVDRLERRLPLLTGGDRDLPDRQRTIRDSIAWSFDLLSPDEQQLFRSLAVFVGSFTLEAAEAVALGAAPDVLGGLAKLVESNLLRRADGLTGETRLSMLDTVREFGLEQLHAHAEAETIQERHAAYYLALAERATPELFGANQVVWLDRLTADHDNLRAAFTWLCTPASADACVRLAAACGHFWYVRGYVHEGRKRLRQALDLPGPNVSAAKAHALTGAAQLAYTARDVPDATALAHQALEMWRTIGDLDGEARALFILAMTEETPHLRWASAKTLYEEALEIWRNLGDSYRIGNVISLLGGVAYGQGDLARARALEYEAAATFREIGDRRCEALCSWYLGLFAAGHGRWTDAAHLYRESLHGLAEVRDASWLTKPIIGLAAVAGTCRRPESAARLLGAAESMLERIGATMTPFDVVGHDLATTSAREALGESGVAFEASSGRKLNLDELLVEADAVVAAAEEHAQNIPRRGASGSGELTTREREVLRLLTLGHTDREIGEAFFISHRTVNAHVASILAKLGVSSRREAAALSRELGMPPISPETAAF